LLALDIAYHLYKTRSPAVVRFQEEAWQELLLQSYQYSLIKQIFYYKKYMKWIYLTKFDYNIEFANHYIFKRMKSVLV